MTGRHPGVLLTRCCAPAAGRDWSVATDQFQRLVPGARLVEQGGEDRGNVGAGDRAPGDRRGCEPDSSGGGGVGEAARAQDGPVEVPGAQIVLGRGLGRDVSRPTSSRPGSGGWPAHGGDLREPATPARAAASASSTEAARSTVSLRAAPLPGPAPAAKTTASAPASSTATSSAAAVSRSHTAASAPAFSAGRRPGRVSDQPDGRSPRSARRRSSRSAIFPCPPAITTRRMGPAY